MKFSHFFIDRPIFAMALSIPTDQPSTDDYQPETLARTKRFQPI
jgi:hypothetical protein